MKTILERFLSLSLLLNCLLCAASQVHKLQFRASAASGREAAATAQTKLREVYGRLPLSFAANHGQFAARVKFAARNPGYSLALMQTEIQLSLPGAAKSQLDLQMKFIGANPDPQLEGVDRLPGPSHYLYRNDARRWRTNVANYAKVVYRKIYPGIDLVFYGNHQQLEYDFVVEPHARPEAIKLLFANAEALRIAADGALLVRVAGLELRQPKPVVYQALNGSRREIAGGYRLSGRKQVSFELGAYDANQPLVIDPVLVYSTTGLGGASIAVDATGNAYLTGTTQATDFPLVNPAQERLAGESDVFVAKLNPTGTALLYSTYLGGSNADTGVAIAVDAQGNAVVAGNTFSVDLPGANKPQTGHIIYKSTDRGGSWTGSSPGLPMGDVRNIALDPKNPSTVYVGMSHPNSQERGSVFKSADGGASWRPVNTGLPLSGVSVLAIDPVNPAILYAGTSLAGLFKSTNGGESWAALNTGLPLPESLSPSSLAISPTNPATLYLTSHTGGQGLYKSADGGGAWTRVDPGLSRFGLKIVVLDPVNPNTLYVGAEDAIYKSTDGGATWQSSSAGLEQVTLYSLVIDPANPAILYAGTSKGIFKTLDGGANWRSSSNGLPAYASSFFCGPSCIDVTIDPANSTTLYAGINYNYEGNGVYTSNDAGASWKRVSAGLGNRDVTVLAVSPLNPAMLLAGTRGSQGDAFITKLNPSGSQLVYTKYLGGSRYEAALAVALDASGDAYVAGVTNSDDFATTANAFRQNFTSGSSQYGPYNDLFITKLSAIGATTYASYLGGSDSDFGSLLLSNSQPYKLGLAVDATGAVYLTGGTYSRDFPVKQALQPAFPQAESSAFITKLDLQRAGADSLVYSTFLGDGGFGQDIAVDPLGNSYVLCLSNLPATAGSYQAAFGFYSLVKLNPTGTTLLYSTKLGTGYGTPYPGPNGRGDHERFTALAVDAAGNAYLTGYTRLSFFPVTPDAAQIVFGGGRCILAPCPDAFVMKLNAAGSALSYATLLGGAGLDSGGALAVDQSGNVYVTGLSFSDNFPLTANALRAGTEKRFVAKLNTSANGRGGNPARHVSAASFRDISNAYAGDSLATAFGSNLATTTALASSLPLPTTLGGTTVRIKDGAGNEQLAPLLFVSPTQLNYQIPRGFTSGATVTITSGDGSFSVATVYPNHLAPALFAANANGSGVAAAVALRVKADGSQSYEPVAVYNDAQKRFVAVSLDLGAASDNVYLILFGTGVRNRIVIEDVRAKVGAVDAEVVYVGAQPNFVGLDQINLRLPRSLAGKGLVNLSLTIDDRDANTVQVNIK